MNNAIQWLLIKPIQNLNNFNWYNVYIVQYNYIYSVIKCRSLPVFTFLFLLKLASVYVFIFLFHVFKQLLNKNNKTNRNDCVVWLTGAGNFFKVSKIIECQTNKFTVDKFLCNPSSDKPMTIYNFFLMNWQVYGFKLLLQRLVKQKTLV